MTASDDYLLGALDAIEEVTERCKGLAYAHRAKGRLDAGYVEAMNDVALVLTEIVQKQRDGKLDS